MWSFSHSSFNCIGNLVAQITLISLRIFTLNSQVLRPKQKFWSKCLQFNYLRSDIFMSIIFTLINTPLSYNNVFCSNMSILYKLTMKEYYSTIF